MSDIKVGQVYRDKDKREHGRHLRIMEINGRKASMSPCVATGELISMRRTQIAVRRLPVYFVLVAQP